MMEMVKIDVAVLGKAYSGALQTMLPTLSTDSMNQLFCYA